MQIRQMPVAAMLLVCAGSVGAGDDTEPPRGFASIFNGKDLKDWDGSAKFWKVEDGALTGVADGKLDYNRFIVWRGGKLKNFELRIKVKVTAKGNSGINYRSTERPELGETVVTGYQCDVVASRTDYNGMLYEERGRRILAHTGEKVIIDKDGQPWVVGALPVKEFKADEWHDYRILVRGNHHQHWIDDQPTVDVIDLDEKGRKLEGVLALQVHVGPPMKIQYKNIFLKRLPDDIALIMTEQAKLPAGAVKVVPQGKAKPKKPAAPVESTRYFRPFGRDAFLPECTFTIVRTPDGMRIKSVTERGNTILIVESNYDTRSHLHAAKAMLTLDEKTRVAMVTVVDGKAKVARDDLPEQAFDVPAGVIVTSAPDWTDTFLLCKHYDRLKAGKQTFPGMWIHPEQNSQRVIFSIERRGADVIQHAGKAFTLDRFTIWLRGNSVYTAWADADGSMIRLVPMPFKDGALTGIVKDGYEKSAIALRP